MLPAPHQALEPAVDPASGWVGVVPQVLDEVFARVSAKEPAAGSGEEATYVVRCSFVEVYNNMIRDLLCRDSNQNIEL
eukprot:scaffold648611_cov37-Prasinocladus_malaysianus.AAC.1